MRDKKALLLIEYLTKNQEESICTLKKTISWIREKIQAELFPHLEEMFTDPITKKQKQLIELLQTDEFFT